MRGYSFIGIIVIGGTIVMAAGCSTTSTRACNSNDECVEKASCSAETGWCVFWESPLTLTMKSDWQDATVGSPYEVEFEASGGFPPYTWILNDGNIFVNLQWLVLTPEGPNNERAKLHNLDEDHMPTPADINTNGIDIKIAVMDYTKRNPDNTARKDNIGESLTNTLIINDCQHSCIDLSVGESECISSTGVVNICNNDALYNCARLESTECDSGSCTGISSPKTASCVTCSNDTVCTSEWSTKCELSVSSVFVCRKGESDCLYWGSKTQCTSGCSGTICAGCDTRQDRCPTYAAVECNSGTMTIRDCWLDSSDGCFVWHDQQGMACNGRGLETCTVAGDGTVTCVCASSALGIFPYCFQPTGSIDDYCATSQCFPVTPTGQQNCSYESTPDVWSTIDCSSTIGGSNPPHCQDGGVGLCGQDAQYPDRARTYSCYDQNKNEKSCNGASVDGDVVKDLLTDLSWQRYVIATSTKYMWEDTGIEPATHPAADYCASLNSNNYGGYNTGWRLPSLIELESLADYSIYGGPTIDTIAFPQTPASGFWSSSQTVIDASCSWVMVFYEGAVSSNGKSLTYYVRCVRSEPREQGSSGDSRFVESESKSGEPIVIDSITGLMWQKDLTKGCPTCTCNTQPCQWEYALSFCESLDYGSYKDWRLPNIKELISLINYSKGGPSPASDFPDMLANVFWSSSTFAGLSDSAWAVFFWAGDVIYGKKSGSLYVRCVRGGP